MTKIVNIDALQEESPFILVVGGVEHPMKPFSVDDFISNMRLIEGLGANPKFTDELDLSIKVIARAFPTLDETVLRSWPVSTIEKLFRISRGEDVTAAGKTEGDAENPPTAS